MDTIGDKPAKKLGNEKYFKQEMPQKTGLPAEYVNALWESFADGFENQKAIHKNAVKITDGLDAKYVKDLTGLDDEIKKIAEDQVFSDKDHCISDQMQYVFNDQLEILEAKKDKLNLLKNLLRSANKSYVKFTKDIQKYLSIGDSGTMALWSGGRYLSTYAYKLGLCAKPDPKYFEPDFFAKNCIPLEATAAGSVMDALYFDSDNWIYMAPLWNILSQAFVMQRNVKSVHIFYRVADDNSVLLRQEVPLLKRLNEPCSFSWHPMVYTGPLNKDCVEVNDKGEQLALSWPGFNTLTVSLYYFIENIKKMLPATVKNLEGTHILGLRTTPAALAPYYNTELTVWSDIMKYEEQIMGIKVVPPIK